MDMDMSCCQEPRSNPREISSECNGQEMGCSLRQAWCRPGSYWPPWDGEWIVVGLAQTFPFLNHDPR